MLIVEIDELFAVEPQIVVDFFIHAARADVHVVHAGDSAGEPVILEVVSFVDLDDFERDRIEAVVLVDDVGRGAVSGPGDGHRVARVVAEAREGELVGGAAQLARYQLHRHATSLLAGEQRRPADRVEVVVAHKSARQFDVARRPCQLNAHVAARRAQTGAKTEKVDSVRRTSERVPSGAEVLGGVEIGERDLANLGPRR